MKRLLRVLALSLVLALTISLATACGGSTAENSAPDTSSESAQPAENTTTGDTGVTTPIVTLKWADHNSDGCMTAQSMDAMAQKVMEESGGRIEIEMYHGGVLGSFGDSVSMVENGICDIVWTSDSMFAGMFPYSEVFQLPMLGFSSAEDVTNAWWDMMEKFPEAFTYEFSTSHLWMAHASPAACIGLSKELGSMADLKGANLRAAAGPAATMATLLGANPVSMSPADMYLGLQKGVIDGYLFDGAGINTWGLAELSKTVVDCGLSTNYDFILINQDVWDSMDLQDQEAFNSVGGREGSQTGASYMQKEADDLFTNFTGDYQKLSSDDALYKELKEPLTGMYADWVKNVNDKSSLYDAQEILDYVQSLVSVYEG